MNATMLVTEESQHHGKSSSPDPMNPRRLLGLAAAFSTRRNSYQFNYHGMVRGVKALFRDCIYELPLRYMINTAI